MKIWIGLALSSCLLAQNDGARVSVTQADVKVLETKLRTAIPYFSKVWKDFLGGNYKTPAIVPLTGNNTCGNKKLPLGNAYYCPPDNTLYYDRYFLAGQMKSIARRLSSDQSPGLSFDGDYGAIVILAHEFGHMAAFQLGIRPSSTLESEQTADCFAGVVTREAKRDGYLDPGDLTEAWTALDEAGDWRSMFYLSNAMDRGEDLRSALIISEKLKREGHPNSAERISAFSAGYYYGPATCAQGLGNPKLPAHGNLVYHASFSSGEKSLHRCDRLHGGLVDGPMRFYETENGLIVSGITYECDLFHDPLPKHFRVEADIQVLNGPDWTKVGIFVGLPDKLDGKYTLSIGSKYALSGREFAKTISWFAREGDGPPFEGKLPWLSISTGLHHFVMDVHQLEVANQGYAILATIDNSFLGAFRTGSIAYDCRPNSGLRLRCRPSLQKSAVAAGFYTNGVKNSRAAFRSFRIYELGD